MITLIGSLLFTGIVFTVLFFTTDTENLWWWYLPVVAAMIRAYCQMIYSRNQNLANAILIKNPDFFADEEDKTFFRVNASIFLPPLELATFFARSEFASALTYASIGSSIFAIIAVFSREWGPAILGVLVFLSIPLSGIGDAFYGVHEENIINSVRRYLRKIGKNPKMMDDVELKHLAKKYEQIEEQLSKFNKGYYRAESKNPPKVLLSETKEVRSNKISVDIQTNEIDQSKTFFGGIHHPWRRFFARTTDILIFGIFSIFIISFFVGLFFPYSVEAFFHAIGNPIIAGVMLSILWIPAEAAFIAGTGTTPAKWIFGISVLDIEEEKLSYPVAFKRAFLVWIQGECFGIPFLSSFTRLFAYRKLTKTGTTLWDTSTKSIVDHKEWGVARASASIFVVILTTFLIVLINKADNDPYNSFDIENKSASLIQSKELTARGYTETHIENKQKNSHILGYDIHLNDGRIISCNEIVKFNNGCFYLFGDNLRMNIPADKIKIINELYKIEDLYKLRAVNKNSILPVANKIVLGYDVVINNGERINCKVVQKESQNTISLLKKNLSKNIFSNEEVENIEEVSAIENGVRVRVIPPESL